MDNDWDLYAVVRGCAAATRSPTPTPTTPLPILPSNQIQFPNLVDQNSDRFMGLQEIYQHFMTNYARQRPPTPAVMPAPPPQMVPVAPPLMQRLPPAALPQHLRLRRRKNLPAKIVRQMTQEELSADSWAWRKYGQKPIKGSPYPRNYYRCSTSKGCGARKQVERSTYDAGIFVVSYTGEHTHARPTHRSSLSGTTRARFPARNNNGVLLHKAPAPAQAPAPAPALSSPSPSVGSSLSPATPSNGGGDGQIDDAENVIQLPDDLMINDEDMFGGFQDSDNSSGGGDFFTAGFLTSPPWSPAESSGNAAAFNGGGHLE